MTAQPQGREGRVRTLLLVACPVLALVLLHQAFVARAHPDALYMDSLRLLAVILDGVGAGITEPEARSDLDDDYTAATKQITAAKSRISEELAGLPRNQWARELAELKREYPTLLEGLTLDRYADTPQNRKLGRAGRVKTTDEGAPQLTFRAPKAGTGSLYAELEGYPAGKGKTTKGLRDVASDMSKAIGSVRRTRDIRVGDLAALTDGMNGPAIEEVRAKAAENPGKLAGARLRNAVLEDMLAERRKVKRAVVRLAAGPGQRLQPLQRGEV